MYKTLFVPVPGGGQEITTSGTSAKTSKAPLGVRAVAISTTEDCYIRMDANASAAATTTDMLFRAAWGVVFMGIPTDAFVHAIQFSTGGTVRVHWLYG